MERSTIFNGNIHYFDWAIFNCYVSSPEGRSAAFCWTNIYQTWEHPIWIGQSEGQTIWTDRICVWKIPATCSNCNGWQWSSSFILRNSVKMVGYSKLVNKPSSAVLEALLKEVTFPFLIMLSIFCHCWFSLIFRFFASFVDRRSMGHGRETWRRGTVSLWKRHETCPT